MVDYLQILEKKTNGKYGDINIGIEVVNMEEAHWKEFNGYIYGIGKIVNVQRKYLML